MAKFGLAALAVVAALVLSFSASSSTPTAHAEVDSSVAIWCGFLASRIDGDPADATTAGDFGAACDGLTEAEIALISGANTDIGDEDGVLEAGELDDLDLDANQVTIAPNNPATNHSTIYIIAFVDDDGLTTFDAQSGVSVVVSEDGGVDEAAPAADADPETCTGDNDEDCGTTDPTNGDGVVVALITATTATDGAAVVVDVDQESVGDSQTLDIVGVAFSVEVTLVETTIQSDAATTCAAGTDPEVTDDGALSDAESTIAIAVVTDNDDRALTRITSPITSDETDVAEVGDQTGATVDAGDSGIAAFAVICGGDDSGTANITADIGADDDSAEITVVGPPATITLTAAPAQIACDGSQTSTVTATIVDSAGNNVANGTDVTFSVVALGTANPINTTTTDGTASSTITPLSGAAAGVTVIVSAGDASASTRVDCSLPIPTVVAPGATPTSDVGVTPPDTGTGGYLGQDSSAGFPLWTLVALALGSFALVAGGMVTRRAGR
ncbi:MAG: invasin domain 3-containing protein [Dehalococcoidia bacterium]